MTNTFGQNFRVTTFGESHGQAVGAVIDGCPGAISISTEEIQSALDRRRPGQSQWTTSRKEKDQVKIVSGCENGVSLGGPICLYVENEDKKPSDYETLKNIYRPSHADYTTQMKYGIRAQSGGGRASARETLGRVAAGSVAEQILRTFHPEIKIVAYVDSVKDLRTEEDFGIPTRDQIDKHPLRCPDKSLIPKIEKLLQDAKQKGDSVGGTIKCLIAGCPPGLGSPVFDKLHADLAKAMLSIPAAKAFEIGSGFHSCTLMGSENNDAFYLSEKGVHTRTNHSGGIQGGISNGEVISMRVGFKAPSTIFKEQESIDMDGNSKIYKLEKGRHDPCVLARAVPIVEAMATLVLTDHYLRNRISSK